MGLRQAPGWRAGAVLALASAALALAVPGGIPRAAEPSPAPDSTAAAPSSPERSPALPATDPDAVLRAASFVTRDLDASVAFYTAYLGYRELGRSEITAPKSRRVVGATGEGTVRYASLAPSERLGKLESVSSISFIEMPDAAPSPFAPDPARAARAGELVLAHRVRNIDEIERRMRAAGVPIVAPLGPSGSGKSRSMAVLDPNGVRVEMYEY